MKLEQSFEVQASLERVWEALIDVERVAPCLPGAEIVDRNDDGSYNGTFKVKIGPTAAAYVGKLRMDKVDADSHTTTMDAQGTDRRGQGSARATIVSAVSAAGPDASRVNVDTEYEITGRLARFGRGGMIEEISNRLLTEFARSLQEMLEGGAAVSEAPAEPEAGAEEAGSPPMEPRFAPKPGPAAAAAAAVEAAATAAEQESAVAAELAAIVPEADPAADPEPDVVVVEEEEIVVEEDEIVVVVEPEPVMPEPPATPAAAPPLPVAGPTPIQGRALAGTSIWSRARSKPVVLFAMLLGVIAALRAIRRRRR
jgi:carbon monoxide dehydrogenase subunit G